MDGRSRRSRYQPSLAQGTTYYSARCHARQATTCGKPVLKFSTQFQRPPSALSSMISYIEGVATSTSPLKMSNTGPYTEFASWQIQLVKLCTV